MSKEYINYAFLETDYHFVMQATLTLCINVSIMSAINIDNAYEYILERKLCGIGPAA